MRLLRARSVRAGLALPALLASAAALADPAPAPPRAPEPVPAAEDEELLPPVAMDRTVVIDSRAALGNPDRRRQLKLSDIDPEQADIVREINRKPGTWQLYLLAVSQDLPEKMFHPGFSIRLPPRKSIRLETPAAADEKAAPEAPAGTPKP